MAVENTKREGYMYALSIRFHLDASTDWDAMRALLRSRADLYRDVPGLVSKAFLLNAVTGEYGGNYVWESEAALDAFLASELYAGARRRFGEPAEVRRYEVVAYVEHAMMHT